MDSTRYSSTREPAPEPMTPERLASIRYWANANHGTRLNLPRAVSNSVILDIKALCDEVERLRSWLSVIEDADGFYSSELAGHALAGEEVCQ